MIQSLFKGVKVVELASVLAGPAVGTFFSELGAEVVKVENKTGGGDVTRQWRLPNETKQGPSAYYASVNWNKKSIFLDLTDREDKRKADQLITEADIIITNFKKGDDLKFGLTYEEVKAISPAIIYGRISGFGTENDRVAYDLILQAETGFMSINGEPEGPPTKMPLALIDLLAAHQLKEGILCALLKQKDNPGQPFLIEVNLYESAVASLINQATNWLMNGNIPKPIGSLHPNIAPYGEVFATKDSRLITLAIGSDGQFTKLCGVLRCKEAAAQSRFSNNVKRVEHREELAEILREEIQKQNAGELLDDLHENRVPAGEIKNVKQVFESEEVQDLLLRERIDGRDTIRPKTAVFNLRS
jgi:crotonobetainyl-CoA:carnitine CoA-transferase CaiB-like acyl-CoA transferase